MTALLPPGKVALAPLAGAVNVTVTPLTGLPAVFVTVATRGIKDVLTVVLCPEPLVAVTISKVVIVMLLLPPHPIIERAAMKNKCDEKIAPVHRRRATLCSQVYVRTIAPSLAGAIGDSWPMAFFGYPQGGSARRQRIHSKSKTILTHTGLLMERVNRAREVIRLT